jgi:hypothetical protein
MSAAGVAIDSTSAETLDGWHNERRKALVALTAAPSALVGTMSAPSA